MNLDNFANCKIWLETTDTANKDTASDEASDVQDGDTPLIGSWIDLSYGIQVKIEKDGTFVVWNDEQTAKGTYTYENNYLVMTSKDVQNEEKGYVKLSDDHFALFTSDSMILDYTTDCFVRRSAADKYDPAKDFSRYNQAWTIASGPDQFVINNETYDANELYIILTEGNRLRIGKPEKIGDSNYFSLLFCLIERLPSASCCLLHDGDPLLFIIAQTQQIFPQCLNLFLFNFSEILLADKKIHLERPFAFSPDN